VVITQTALAVLLLRICLGWMVNGRSAPGGLDLGGGEVPALRSRTPAQPVSMLAAALLPRRRLVAHTLPNGRPSRAGGRAGRTPIAAVQTSEGR
jgi:hypothetical protein